MSELDPSVPSTPSTPPGPPANNGGSASDVIDVDLLIAEVKKRPILHDKANEKAGKAEWSDVCTVLYKKEWNTFCPRTKAEKTREVQRKWYKVRENFLKSHGGVKKISDSAKKKRQQRNQSMAFLLPAAVARDMEMGDSDLPLNTNPEPRHPGLENLPHFQQPQVDMRAEMPIPSTSTQVPDFASTYDVKKKPFYIPVPQFEQPIVEPMNPNLHFALMLVSLLNELSSERRYDAWVAILNVIRDAEGPKKFSILQNELKYQETVQGQSHLLQHFAAQGLHHYPPEVALPLIQQMPEMAEMPQIPQMSETPDVPTDLPPESHGRPRNAEGEIIYPETDQEDLDDV